MAVALGLAEPDRIRHGWRCTRPPSEDHYVVDKVTGQPRVIRRCPLCLAVEPDLEVADDQ